MAFARVILDFVGLPIGVPGNVECRLRRAHYRADGTAIDDGTRSALKQLGCHRFVLEPGDDIEDRIDQQVIKGYGRPDTSLMHVIAAHEWQPNVIAARKEALRVNGPTLRLFVRALGFDVVGAGELAVGLGKAIINGPDDVRITEKSAIKLLPGDPIDIVIEAIRTYAAEMDFLPPTELDFGLVRHVAEAVWTPALVDRRRQAWLDWQRTAPISLAQGVATEFADRLQPLGNWHPAPTQPELARLN